ncbi:hypothetical protein GOP47_0004759 [Adiantum capillus-veneris]|uniref:Cell cycle checkpoint protein RAD17 n=1 Tax=Adiantum capillus-veneris TaxID=13818 RepID=A0A9D4V4E2_ADICA|nr:hypothetical protein GOP47_0004759 [Adiantum capillus-veneris]
MGKKRRHTFIFLSDDEDADNASRQQPAADNGGASQASSTSFHSHIYHSEKCGLAKLENVDFGVKCPTQFPDLQPWTDKYSPREISDLVVHAKKVADVREWMVTTLKTTGKPHDGGNVLLLSGPTGAGKTAVVHVLVNQFQEVELCEWDPPVPTLWKEHLHVNADIPYISKVDQFIDFLSKVKKYSGLPLVRKLTNEGNRSPLLKSGLTRMHKVLLIDDLPVVHGRELLNKLCHCLRNFALSVQFPTIVIATDFSEEEHGQGTSFLTVDVAEALESGGAKKVLFNPITANAVKKVLNKIVLAENCSISSESVSFIAESCGGDIRHAINCLQFLCVGFNSVSGTWDPGGKNILYETPKRRRGLRNGTRNKSKRFIKCAASASDHTSSIGCRDGSLSLFHALGKVLHNKRLTENDKDSGKSNISFILKDELQRHPLNMEAPELLISQAHVDAASFLYFLHENVLEFVDEEGIEDVSVAFTYFSDVDCLLKHKKPNTSGILHTLDEIDSGHIAEAVAGSIAARGALFANSHPSKPRWLSLRAPVVRQVDRLLNQKKAELRAKSWRVSIDCSTMFTHNVQATELEPFYKHIGCTSFATGQSANIADSSLSFVDNELNSSLSFLQDEDLLSNIMAIDLSKAMDADIMEKSDDEIEEW